MSEEKAVASSPGVPSESLEVLAALERMIPKLAAFTARLQGVVDRNEHQEGDDPDGQ